MNIFKAIYEDIKTDIAFLKDISKGKYKSEYFTNILLSIVKHILTGGFWKRMWIFFILIILAYFVGRLTGAWHYQDVCNQYILDNFYNDTFIPIGTNFSFQ